MRLSVMSTKQLGFLKGSTEGTTVSEGRVALAVLLDVVVEVLVVIVGSGGGFVEVVVATISRSLANYCVEEGVYSDRQDNREIFKPCHM